MQTRFSSKDSYIPYDWSEHQCFSLHEWKVLESIHEMFLHNLEKHNPDLQLLNQSILQQTFHKTKSLCSVNSSFQPFYLSSSSQGVCFIAFEPQAHFLLKEIMGSLRLAWKEKLRSRLITEDRVERCLEHFDFPCYKRFVLVECLLKVKRKSTVILIAYPLTRLIALRKKMRACQIGAIKHFDALKTQIGAGFFPSIEINLNVTVKHESLTISPHDLKLLKPGDLLLLPKKNLQIKLGDLSLCRAKIDVSKQNEELVLSLVDRRT